MRSRVRVRHAVEYHNLEVTLNIWFFLKGTLGLAFIPFEL